MSRKTETLSSEVLLDGADKKSAIVSIVAVLNQIELQAELEGREALYDTLELNIEREVIEERFITGAPIVTTTARVQAYVKAVKLRVSETTKEKE
jgi:hypothetical protein